MTYTEIHIWGDSLARGIIYNETSQRYAISRERCATRLQAELGCKIENHANMGATVLDGLALFERFTPVPGALCAIEFGGNDCDLDWKTVSTQPTEPVQAKVALDVYAQGLTTFVERVRARGMQPLLVTPLPLHAERYFRWVTRGLDADAVLQALGDVYHIYRWQERYANTVRAVARATHCRLLDLRDVFLAQPNYEKLMCLDGIHPNDAGHRVLSDAVLDVLRAEAAAEGSAAAEAATAAYTAIPCAAKVS